MCIMPLSIVIAKFNLFPRHDTKAGESRFVSCSGNNAFGIGIPFHFPHNTKHNSEKEIQKSLFGETRKDEKVLP